MKGINKFTTGFQTVWLNARREKGTNEPFRWVEDKLHLTQSYTNWEKGEPDSREGNCVIFSAHNAWYTRNCSDNVTTLCVFG